MFLYSLPIISFFSLLFNKNLRISVKSLKIYSQKTTTVCIHKCILQYLFKLYEIHDIISHNKYISCNMPLLFLYHRFVYYVKYLNIIGFDKSLKSNVPLSSFEIVFIISAIFLIFWSIFSILPKCTRTRFTCA